MLATAGLELLQLTPEVSVWLLPSEKVPVSVNCWLAPGAKTAPLGLIDKDCNVAALTRTTALPVRELTLACTFAWPVASPVTSPVSLTMAMDGAGLLQVTCELISAVLPSEYIPVAVSCLVVPFAMRLLVGVTTMEESVAVEPPLPTGCTFRMNDAVDVPYVAVTVTGVVLSVWNAEARPAGVTLSSEGSEDVQVTRLVRSSLVPSA